MGEEAKQDEVKGAEAPPLKQEEKPAAVAAEEKKEEEKKEEAKPSPPPPVVLFVGLHCVGCAKKIQRSILKCRGVEAVETNIEKNEVIVRGAMLDPQALCSQIRKKTSRNAKLLSPAPPPTVVAPDDNNSESKPPPQVSGVSTVELLVNMHCEACAQQLKKKILKMRGVQVVETDLSAKKVTVTGTMNEDKLVEYIHRRTGKFAKINPRVAPLEEKKDDDVQKLEEEKKVEDKGTEEKKEEAVLKKIEVNKEEKEAGEGGGDKEPKKEEQVASTEEMMKRMVYWNGPSGYMMNNHEDDMAKLRVAMMHHWMPMPMLMSASTMYPLEQPRMPPPPPPQMFSDENPNACCIS